MKGNLTRRRPAPRLSLAPVALIAAIALAAGCGGSAEVEPTYDPVSFVEAMNAEGAGLTLGPVLTVNQDGIDVNTVTLADAATAEAPGDHTHGSGALVVLPDDETAGAEVQRCRAAPALTCFRVANAVVRFEELSREDEARLISAVTALGGDPG